MLIVTVRLLVSLGTVATLMGECCSPAFPHTIRSQWPQWQKSLVSLKRVSDLYHQVVSGNLQCLRFKCGFNYILSVSLLQCNKTNSSNIYFPTETQCGSELHTIKFKQYCTTGYQYYYQYHILVSVAQVVTYTCNYNFQIYCYSIYYTYMQLHNVRTKHKHKQT